MKKNTKIKYICNANELLMYTMSNSNFQMIIKRLEYSLYSEFHVIWDLSFSYTMYIQNVKIWNKIVKKSNKYLLGQKTLQ